MNAAAHELGKHAGAISHQRSREPILATARRMRAELGMPPAPALAPVLVLSNADRVS